MITTTVEYPVIRIPAALRVIAPLGATLGLLGTVLALLAYTPGHPGFSPFNTYLSDIGDTPGWPQVLFNSTALVSAPIRYLVIVLVVLSLCRLGAGRSFANTILVCGAVTTFGNILLTAVPFSVSHAVHMAGIPLYFFGLVIWQSVMAAREWQLKVPRLLPLLSFLVAVSFLVFFILVGLNQAGLVSRDAAPIWQWAGFLLSLAWAYAHGILLSRIVPALSL